MDKDIANEVNSVVSDILSGKIKVVEDLEYKKKIQEERKARQEAFRREQIDRWRKSGAKVEEVVDSKTNKVIYKITHPSPQPLPKPQTFSPFDQFLKDNEVCDNDLCRKIKEVYNNKVEEAKKSGGCNSCKMNAIKRSMVTYIEAYQKFLATRQKSSCNSGNCALPSPATKQYNERIIKWHWNTK